MTDDESMTGARHHRAQLLIFKSSSFMPFKVLFGSTHVCWMLNLSHTVVSLTFCMSAKRKIVWTALDEKCSLNSHLNMFNALCSDFVCDPFCHPVCRYSEAVKCQQALWKCLVSSVYFSSLDDKSLRMSVTFFTFVAHASENGVK